MQKALIGVPQSGHTLGNPTALVTVIEFADLQCPFCDTYTLTNLPELIARYVVTGKVKMVFRDLPFLGPDSVIAGRAAAAAGYQNKLWDFVDAFYYQQRAENTGYVTSAFLRKVAGTVPGLDVARMMADLRLSSTLADLRADAALGMANDVKGTPTFIILRDGVKPVRVSGGGGVQTAINEVVGR